MWRISYSRYERKPEKGIPNQRAAEELLANSLWRSVPIKSWWHWGMETGCGGESLSG